MIPLILTCALFLSVPSLYAQTVKEHNKQGLGYLKQNKVTAAIAEFSKAIEADHNNSEGYTPNRAIAFAQLGNLTGCHL